MTGRFISKFLIAIIFLHASFAIYAAEETLVIDNQHSYVLWSLEHLGFSTQTGKWFVNGTIVADKDKPENSKVKVDIKMADMVTGIPELDKHLQGKDFFNVAEYPTATFISDKIDITGKDSGKIHGVLTLHGISKPIILDAKLKKIGENPITHRMTAGFAATTEIKRSDFGINAYLPALGDDVKIQIAVEAYKPQEKKA